MRIGSFTLDSTLIHVDTDYNAIDGVVYHFTQASDGTPIAVTSYRGISLADGARFSKPDLQRGLDSVRKTATRR